MASTAVIGVGRIGIELVGRLVAAGYDVSVFDIQPDRGEVAAQLGARPAADLGDAVDTAEVVFTVLPGSPELRELVLTRDALLPHLRTGATWIDLTSAGYELSRAAAARA